MRPRGREGAHGRQPRAPFSCPPPSAYVLERLVAVFSTRTILVFAVVSPRVTTTFVRRPRLERRSSLCPAAFNDRRIVSLLPDGTDLVADAIATVFMTVRACFAVTASSLPLAPSFSRMLALISTGEHGPAPEEQETSTEIRLRPALIFLTLSFG